MLRFINPLILAVAVTLGLGCSTLDRSGSQLKGFHRQAIEESLIAVRPGKTGGRPFWNTHARRFIYAPAFHFKTIGGAEKYRFTVTSSVDNKERVFLADEPWASLAPVWNQLPVGEVAVKVEGVDGSGQIIRQSKLADRPGLYQDFDASGYPRLRKFWRAAVFRGGYHDISTTYRASAVKALRHLFNKKHIQNWATSGDPDPGYELYKFPSKTVRAVVDSMIMYSKVSPADSARAIRIAESAADYLIRQSQPEGAPLEYMPPTYEGTSPLCTRYAGQIMMIYPAGVAETYLDLYGVTKSPKYLLAAKKIAQTYAKMQLPSGTWHLKIDATNGKPVVDNLCVPTAIIQFFDRLADECGLQIYTENSKRAFKYIMDNPVRTFNWEGQFEDVEPSRPYRNLARGQACAVAMYLLDHSTENDDYIGIAEELLRFVEDQFVIWEKPFPTRDKDVWGKLAHSKDWITPCVLEQYGYYVPIDASAAKMIAACQKAYLVTGEELYLAKACALADAMVLSQDTDKTGWYPTYWWTINGSFREEYWLNCTAYDIKVMLKMGEIVQKNKKVGTSFVISRNVGRRKTLTASSVGTLRMPAEIGGNNT